MSYKKGTLYLIPTPLGDQPALDLPVTGLAELLNQIEVFIVEEERTARRFLRKAGFTGAFDQTTLLLLNEQTRPGDTIIYLEACENGRAIGLISEAGLPCIADPGAIVVAAAHAQNIRVVPLPGASSILLALIASGMNGQNFAFNGYLPIDKSARAKKIKELEARALKEQQTQIFMETPYRNMQMLETILKTCHPDTRLCVACDLTQETESIISCTIAQWQKKELHSLHKRPAVFLLVEAVWVEG
jgi:16S rRNA (cytidine1402-2'-O)-methyltransferase